MAVRRFSGIRGFLMMLVAVATLLSALAFSAATAPEASAHGAGTNGCSFVPDSSYFFNFHSSCDTHDLCYGQKWYGNSSAGRSACDSLFYSDMIASCNAKWYKRWSHAAQRGVCKGTAWTYYTGVRLFGGPAFNSGSPSIPLA